MCHYCENYILRLSLQREFTSIEAKFSKKLFGLVAPLSISCVNFFGKTIVFSVLNNKILVVQHVSIEEIAIKHKITFFLFIYIFVYLNQLFYDLTITD